MSNGRLLSFILSLMLVFASLGVRAQTAAEPTVSQIYATASSGDIRGARTMIDEVIARNPDSGKAHYVKAELAVRDNDLATARSELQQAERLAPGLPFVRPEAVAALRSRLDTIPPSTTAQGTGMGHPDTQAMGAPPPDSAPAQGGFSLGSLLVPALLVGGAMMLFRRRRTTGGMGMPHGPRAAPTLFGRRATIPPHHPQQSPHQHPRHGGVDPGDPSAHRGGLGSSLGRGVATGLAIGAGAVAAQEIGRRVFDPDGPRDGQDAAGSQADSQLARDAGLGGMDPTLHDMGGRDFGIADDGAGWDGGGMGDVSGDDWNS